MTSVENKDWLVWLRRDLRLTDHAALSHALTQVRRNGGRVHLAFIFDRDILDPLLAAGAADDRRVDFIYRCVERINRQLASIGCALNVRHGRAQDEIPRLVDELNIGTLAFNRDHEPAARARDEAVRAAIEPLGCAVKTFCDHVIFDADEILTAEGQPYRVFTAYKNAWLARAHRPRFARHRVSVDRKLWATRSPVPAALPTLASLGFVPSDLARLDPDFSPEGARACWARFVRQLAHYERDRNTPALDATSHLSVHLRFGTLSIRRLAAWAWRRAQNSQCPGAATWLSELIWRDFFHMLLAHHPRVVEHAFRPEYDALTWDNNPTHFARWCAGQTGYPLVDAAMRQLNQTGWMHNRLRMVSASFLVKDLGIDWRWGEKYFALKLLDFDLAANNGNWQWVASTGCDAQPYFRIFNPITQSERFDAEGTFIRRYVPEVARFNAALIHTPWKATAAQQQAAECIIGRDYPAPVIEHSSARIATLARYAAVATQRRSIKP